MGDKFQGQQVEQEVKYNGILYNSENKELGLQVAA